MAAWLARRIQGRNQSGVDRQLRPSPKWETVGDDLFATVILPTPRREESMKEGRKEGRKEGGKEGRKARRQEGRKAGRKQPCLRLKQTCHESSPWVPSATPNDVCTPVNMLANMLQGPIGQNLRNADAYGRHFLKGFCCRWLGLGGGQQVFWCQAAFEEQHEFFWPMIQEIAALGNVCCLARSHHAYCATPCLSASPCRQNRRCAVPKVRPTLSHQLIFPTGRSKNAPSSP